MCVTRSCTDMFLCTLTCFIVRWHVSLHMACSLQLLPNVHQCTVKQVTVHWCLLPNVHQCTVKQVTVHWCLLPNVHQCTVKQVTVHWCLLPNVHRCTMKQVTVHWCLLPNVHQCTVKQVTVHWCLLPNVHQCTVKQVTVHWCLLPNVHQCTVKQVTVRWCLLPNVHHCTVKQVTVHWCTFGNSCKLCDVGWTACFFTYLGRCLLHALASTLLQSQEGSFCLFIWNVVRFCVSVWERVCVYPDGRLSDVFHWSGISALSFDSTFLPGLLVSLSSPAPFHFSVISLFCCWPSCSVCFPEMSDCFFWKVASCWSSYMMINWLVDGIGISCFAILCV